MHYHFVHGVKFQNWTASIFNDTEHDINVIMIPYCFKADSYMPYVFACITFLPTCMALMQGLFVFYSRNVQNLFMLAFTYALWVWSCLVQHAIKSERPHPECIPFAFYEYGLPAPEIVYITSVAASMLSMWYIIKRKKPCSYSNVFILLVLIVLYPYIYYSGFMCTFLQAFLSTLIGVIPTIMYAKYLTYMDDMGIIKYMKWKCVLEEYREYMGIEIVDSHKLV